MTEQELKQYFEAEAAKAGKESTDLERQAVALVNQYRMVLVVAPPAKAFFKRLAVFLKWSNLEKAL